MITLGSKVSQLFCERKLLVNRAASKRDKSSRRHTLLETGDTTKATETFRTGDELAK